MSTQSHLHDEGAMDLFLSLAPLCTSNSCYFSTCVNVFTLQYSLSTNIMALWLLNSLWIKYFMYPLKKRGGGGRVSINSFFILYHLKTTEMALIYHLPTSPPPFFTINSNGRKSLHFFFLNLEQPLQKLRDNR